MGLGRYRELLRTPSLPWLLITSLLGRLPNGMEGLALLLLVTRHGSYAAAGAVTGSYLIATCLSAPYLARAADVFGRRRVLLLSAAAHAAATIGLALVATRRPLLFAFATLAGATTPPLGASARAVWPSLVGADQRQTIFALEASLQELSYIAGPAVVALLAAAGGPRLAVAGCGLITLAGTAAFTADPAADRGRREPGAASSPAVLRTRGLPRLVAAGITLIGSVSITEIGVVAFVSGRQASATAGIALAIWSLGSLVGGVVLGARRTGTITLRALLLVIAVGFAVLAAAPGPVVLTALLFAGGTAVAPALAQLYDRVGTAAPEGTTTEAFGWLASGLLAGAAGGAALGGVLVSAYGPRPAFLAAAVMAAGSAAVVRGNQSVRIARAARSTSGHSGPGSLPWRRRRRTTV